MSRRFGVGAGARLVWRMVAGESVLAVRGDPRRLRAAVVAGEVDASPAMVVAAAAEQGEREGLRCDARTMAWQGATTL